MRNVFGEFQQLSHPQTTGMDGGTFFFIFLRFINDKLA